MELSVVYQCQSFKYTVRSRVRTPFKTASDRRVGFNQTYRVDLATERVVDVLDNVHYGKIT